MQDKYVNQIWDLYEDFHVVLMPLLNHEVRGATKLEAFSNYLVDDGEGASVGEAAVEAAAASKTASKAAGPREVD